MLIIPSIWDNSQNTLKVEEAYLSAKNGEVGFVLFKLWQSIFSSTRGISRTFFNPSRIHKARLQRILT